jgi:hypothetical protein
MQGIGFHAALRAPARCNGEHRTAAMSRLDEVEPHLPPAGLHAVANSSRGARGERLAAVGMALLISLACGVLVAAVVMLTYQSAARMVIGQGG